MNILLIIACIAVAGYALSVAIREIRALLAARAARPKDGIFRIFGLRFRIERYQMSEKFWTMRIVIDNYRW